MGGGVWVARVWVARVWVARVWVARVLGTFSTHTPTNSSLDESINIAI